MKTRYAALGAVLAIAIAGTTAVPTPLAAQSKTVKPAAAQKIDEEYTRLIKQNLQDPRITTELVDHLPASDTVPSPLKFLGRAVGAPGELTYAKDIYRYYEALAKAAPTRAKYWKVGTTEEGRDIVLLAVGSGIRSEPRQISRHARRADRSAQDREAPARHCPHRQPSTTRSAAALAGDRRSEMLIRLAYRLIVEETPFIRTSAAT
jgi:hypothetical protein